MVSTVAHAIFFDVTHDNESPIVKHTAYDPIASSALVSMTYAAIGSNRGLDELVPHHIHVVKEERTYNVWSETDAAGVNYLTGMINGKRFLNQLHEVLATLGYSQAYVDQRDRDTIVVTRHNPNNHKSVILAARTAFYQELGSYATDLKPLTIEGKFDKILFEISMNGDPIDFEKDETIINGYKSFFTEVSSLIEPTQSQMVEVEKCDTSNVIHFKHFPPSSVIAFSMSLLDEQTAALEALNEILKQYDCTKSDIFMIINQYHLIDINYVLFRTNEEERDEFGHGTYAISTGPLVYCGLAGVMTHLAKIRTHNDLGLYTNVLIISMLLINFFLNRSPSVCKSSRW